MLINDNTIETMEGLADTRLHLSNGETRITRLTPEEVITQMVAIRVKLLVNGPELRPHFEGFDEDAPRRLG